METRTSTRDTPRATPDVVGTARPPAVIAPLSAPLLPTASTVGLTEVGADRPALPDGPVTPLMTAGPLIRRADRRTTGRALAVNLFIGGGAVLTPDTGEHLRSGDTALIVLPAERGAPAALVRAGAAAIPARKGASA